MTDDVQFLVKRGAIGEAHVARPPLPALAPGQALLRVDALAITANTVTYAAFGEMMRYWDFFPADLEGYGRPPAWGFADVVESNADGVAVGDRFYGYVPIAAHLIVAPTRVNAGGFVDASAHRQHLAPAYNGYFRVAKTDPDAEALRMLLAPLFTTSFVLDAHLAEGAQFGAKRVALSSASSKTAIGLAFLLHRRGVPVLGLTSPANAAFCRALKIYSDVKTYDEVATLDAAPTAYVDFAGAAALRTALHTRLGAALVSDIMVGATDWSAGGPTPDDLPGAKPTFFFAPDVIKARVAEWGRQAYDDKLAGASSAFNAFAPGWLKVRRIAGPDAVRAAWRDAVAGAIGPEDGVIASLTQA